MTLIKWNPEKTFSSIRWMPERGGSFLAGEIEKLFNAISYDLPLANNEESEWKPHFEALNTEEAYRLRADLPGMAKKDVNIDVCENVLTVSGERNDGVSDQGDGYSGFAYGKFSRSFNLSEDIELDGIKASMKNGVLLIEIPRIKKVLPETKKIAIK